MLLFILALALPTCQESESLEASVAVATQDEAAFIEFAQGNDIEDFDELVEAYEASLPPTYAGRGIRQRIQDRRNARTDTENEEVETESKKKKRGLLEIIQGGREGRANLQKAKAFKWIGLAIALASLGVVVLIFGKVIMK